MPRFTTILCDLDGTLVDSSRDIVEAFQVALRVVACTSPPAAADIIRHIGKPLAQMVRELGYPLSAQQLVTFLDTYRTAYSRHCVRHTHPYPRVKVTLQRLSTTTFGVVTTKYRVQAEHILQRLQLATFFRHIQGGDPGLRLKPAPDTVLATLEALQCPPQQALMVGDTTADILAGKAAGIPTCAATYGFGSLVELQGCQPDYYLTSFSDLAAVVVGPASARCS
ncbi:Phosphoglycolate phosphatase [Candidatus Entotheonellaceae bacterium PAL068K]